MGNEQTHIGQAHAHGASPARGPTLREKTVRGAAWVMAGFGFGQALRLGGNIALAHICPPSAFGLMNTVNLVQQGLMMFSDLGIGASILQHKKGNDKVFLRTAWTVQIVRAVVLMLIGLTLAWPIATLYSEPALGPLMAFNATLFLLGGFMSTGIFTAQRDLALGKMTFVEIVSQAVSLVGMVATAWIMANAFGIITNGKAGMPDSLANSPAWDHVLVWSLALGSLVHSGTRLLLGHVYLPGTLGPGGHGLAWDGESRKELFNFGRWILFSTMLTFAAGQIDRLILPKIVEPTIIDGRVVSSIYAQVGYYTVAFTLSQVPVEIVSRVGGSVLIAAYAKVRRDGTLPEAVFGKVAFLSNTLGGVAIAALITAAPAFIRLVYPESFHSAAIILQPLAIVAWFRILQNNVQSALIALGKPKGGTAANAAKLIAACVLMPVGYFAGMRIGNGPVDGLTGLTLGLAISEVLKYAVMAWAAQRNGLNPLSADIRATLTLGVVYGLWMAGHFALKSVANGPIIEVFASTLVVLVVYVPLLLRATALAGLADQLAGALSKIPVIGSSFARLALGLSKGQS